MAKKLTRSRRIQQQQQQQFQTDETNSANNSKSSNCNKYSSSTNKKIYPKSRKQEEALESLYNNTLTILTGPPGTAKTLLAAFVAVEMLEARTIDKIYYSKPIVKIPSVEGIGFLPGTVDEKTSQHLAPLLDALRVFMAPQKIEYLISPSKKIIEFVPIDVLRGRSLNNCFIIADEVQNTVPEVVFTILTRLGSNSSISLLGDIVQRDLATRFGRDGLSDFIHRTKLYGLSDYAQVEFDADDCFRSEFVKKIIYCYRDLYEV